MHYQSNIQQFYILTTLYVFCIYLRTNRDFCPVRLKLIGFYNQDEKCLLRGTNWVFNKSSLRFVFKGLMNSIILSINTIQKFIILL
jgi:hypothetical protein